MGYDTYWNTDYSLIENGQPTGAISHERVAEIRAAIMALPAESKLVAMFDGEPVRNMDDETAAALFCEFSKQFPEVLFHIEQDASSYGGPPGYYHYHCLNGKWRDVTPPFEPLEFDESLME